jgi:hypothetical protein
VIGILLTILVAALVYALCGALGLPAIVGLVAAILVILSGFPTGVYGRRGDRLYRPPPHPSGARRAGLAAGPSSWTGSLSDPRRPSAAPLLSSSSDP